MYQLIKKLLRKLPGDRKSGQPPNLGAPYGITVEEVAAVATEAHKGQFRRDGVTPYIEHPKAVAERVKGDPLAEMTAFAHDLLEDTDETISSLRKKGVPLVVLVPVLRLTKIKSESYDDYLAQLKRDPIATKVKIADMEANLADKPTKKQIEKYTKGLAFLRS